jgi:type II secretory pathway pseudopilin PulG
MVIAVTVGCLGAIVVGGILAAVLIPNFLDALQRARIKRTAAQMHEVGTRLEGYRDDHGSYPPATTMAGLAAALREQDGLETPAIDGWRNPILYTCWSDTPGVSCDTFRLVSAARGGVFEQVDPRDYQPREIERGDYDADIVLGPEGFLQMQP